MTTCGLPIAVEGAFEPEEGGDALVVVAGFNILQHTTPKLRAGIRQAARRGKALGGVEAGSWSLGSA